MNNVLQLNYYEEHQKYEGGNGIKFLIDKNPLKWVDVFLTV